MPGAIDRAHGRIIDSFAGSRTMAHRRTVSEHDARYAVAESSIFVGKVIDIATRRSVASPSPVRRRTRYAAEQFLNGRGISAKGGMRTSRASSSAFLVLDQ